MGSFFLALLTESQIASASRFLPGVLIFFANVGWGIGVAAGELKLPPLPRSDTSDLVMPTELTVREFHFAGNTLFSSEELGKITQPYANRLITSMELEEARVALTTFYIDRGYVNSGAVIDDLPDLKGVVTVNIVEGKLTEVTIQGNRWIRKGFYEKRLFANGGQPLNVNRLRNTLQVWREAYPVEQVNAELRPGALPGQATLDVKVREKFPYHLGVQYANDKPPSTGAEQVNALLRADSLTLNGDRLALDYGIARAGGNGMDRGKFLGVDDLAASYSLPFQPKDTSLGLQYVRNSASVVEAPFDQLDITSQSEVFGLSLSQPVVRTPSRELTLSLSGERKSNQTSLLGVPYSFSPGAADGESVVSAVRFSSQFVDRSAQHVFAARGIVSGGLNVFSATDHPVGPDGQFFSLIGQLQYLRRLWNTPNEVVIRVTGQYTPDALLTLEQLAIGGVNTVRGYRENTMIRDRGFVAAMEFHLPLLLSKEKRPYVQLAPFTSWGTGYNNDRPTPSPKEVASAGIGIILTPWKNMEASFYWGHAFRDIRYPNRNLQDDGINFKITLWAF